MVWNLALVGGGTLGIGLLPTYQEAGYLGLALLLAFRLMQGLGVGGEWGGAAALVTEQAAGSRWRAFWASWVQQGTNVGSLAATGMVALLFALYPGDAFYSFGWRVAYYVGAAGVAAAVALRWLLAESALFQRLAERGQTARAPSLEMWRGHWRDILLAAVLFTGQNATWYLVYTFGPRQMTALGMPGDQAFAVMTLGLAAGFLSMPLFGALADRLGRRRAFLAAYLPLAAAFLLYFPTLHTASLPLIAAATFAFFFFNLAGPAIQVAYFSELFPTRYRYSAAGTAYALGTALGGGLATVLAPLLGPGWTALAALGTAYIAAALLALALLRETLGAQL